MQRLTFWSSAVFPNQSLSTTFPPWVFSRPGPGGRLYAPLRSSMLQLRPEMLDCGAVPSSHASSHVRP